MTMTATYSPEDNKLRLYASSRLDNETYQRVKKAGFKWAPKQELFVAPRWTPDREDLLLELCGEIEDEDYSPEERSADRAERFSGYRDKRRSEAHGHADTFEAGPSAFGHQNRQRAERQAARHDRHRTRSLTQWSKAEYWQTRTEGVIGHALYKSSPDVRRSRLIRLESEQRKHLKDLEAAASKFKAWQYVTTLPDCDEPCKSSSGNPRLIITIQGGRSGKIGYAYEKATSAAELAGTLANYGCNWGRFKHPRRELNPEQYDDGKKSLYDLLADESDPITPREAAELYLGTYADPERENGYFERWRIHYELRVGYEKAMLEAEGGMVGDLEMEPGGWIRPSRRDIQFGRAVVNNDGWCQVLRVNKSPKTGRVTSVAVLGADPYLNDHEVKPRTVKVERLGEDSYRPPTDEERKAFKAKQAKAKRKARASAPKTPKLINPTDEDAERIQGILNAIAKAKHEASESRHYKDYEPVGICRMTQEQYSAASKGSYSHLETRTLHNYGGIMARRSSNLWSSEGSAYDKALGPAVCKGRTRCPSGFSYVTPQRIVIITDKPQKPLPLDWDNLGPELPKSEPAEVH